MPVSQASGVVVYRGNDEIDAIEEYSRRLVAALSAVGNDARYVPGGLTEVLGDHAEPAWILLQYNPFRYGRAGIAPGLLLDVRRLRHRSRVPLLVMVHEAWIDITDWRSALIGGWQRVQLRDLLHLADGVITSTQSLADAIGGGAVHVPIATTITPVAVPPGAARAVLGLDSRLVVALFGRGNPSRALDHAEAAIAAIADAHGAEGLAVLNLGADAPPLRLPPGVEVTTPGALPADELSLRLHASDLVLLPFKDGVSTRRTTLMAALAHGVPVLGLSGGNTDTVLASARDALVLTPVGDLAAFSRAAVALAADRPRRQAIGEAGRPCTRNDSTGRCSPAKSPRPSQRSRLGGRRRGRPHGSAGFPTRSSSSPTTSAVSVAWSDSRSSSSPGCSQPDAGSRWLLGPARWSATPAFASCVCRPRAGHSRSPTLCLAPSPPCSLLTTAMRCGMRPGRSSRIASTYRRSITATGPRLRKRARGPGGQPLCTDSTPWPTAFSPVPPKAGVTNRGARR